MIPIAHAHNIPGCHARHFARVAQACSGIAFPLSPQNKMAAVTWEGTAGTGWRVVPAATRARAFRHSSHSDAARRPHNEYFCLRAWDYRSSELKPYNVSGHNSSCPRPSPTEGKEVRWGTTAERSERAYLEIKNQKTGETTTSKEPGEQRDCGAGRRLIKRAYPRRHTTSSSAPWRACSLVEASGGGWEEDEEGGVSNSPRRFREWRGTL